MKLKIYKSWFRSKMHTRSLTTRELGGRQRLRRSFGDRPGLLAFGDVVEMRSDFSGDWEDSGLEAVDGDLKAVGFETSGRCV